MRNTLLSAVFGAATLIFPAQLLAQDETASTASSTPTARDAVVDYGAPEPVTLVTAEGEFTIQAEIANTPAQMERGLMWRESLAADAGMLFHYDPARRASMWMENTLIDLDLVFIRADGSIAKIIAFAQAGSRRSLSADAEVTGVLELAAGRAFETGLRPGDTVIHPIFATPDADAAAADAPEDAE